MLTLSEDMSSLERGIAVSDFCEEWKRRLRSSTTALEFEIILLICFEWKILLKEKLFVTEERLLLKLPNIR